MEQTHLESMVESLVNQFTGILVSVVVTATIVVPIWDLKWSMFDNVVVTLIFTVASIIRSYIWRRFFNAGLHKVVHNYLRKLYARES